MKFKKCEHCGREFETYQKVQKYCSRKCYWKTLKGIKPIFQQKGMNVVIRHDKQFKKGMVPWNKGKSGFTKTLKTRGIQSESNRGEKNKSWQGGKTSLGNRIRACFKNRIWKTEVQKRDNYTCLECGKKYNGRRMLDTHHIISVEELILKHNIKSVDDALKIKEFWDINNGMTLCIKCHRQIESQHKP